MRRTVRGDGVTLIELLVALFLLSVVALGLTTTLTSTRRVLSASEKWMQAAQLAAEGMEQLRAGHIPAAGLTAGGFDRTVRVTPWSGHSALQRLEVTVTWDDGERYTFQLVTLTRH